MKNNLRDQVASYHDNDPSLVFEWWNLRETGVKHERWIIIAATRAQFPFLPVIFVFILLFLLLVFFALSGAAIRVRFYSHLATTFGTAFFPSNLKLKKKTVRKQPKKKKLTNTVRKREGSNVTLIFRRSLLASEFADSTLIGVPGWESRWLRSVGIKRRKSEN